MQTRSATNVWTWLRKIVGVVAVVLVGGGLVSGGARPAQASEGSERIRPAADTTAPIIRSVDVRGNRHFSEETLKRNVLELKGTRADAEYEGQVLRKLGEL